MMALNGSICIALLEQSLAYSEHWKSVGSFLLSLCQSPCSTDDSQPEENVPACGHHDCLSAALQISIRVGEKQGLQTHSPEGNC